MSIPRRLGRLAWGFVSKNIDEERLRETIRIGRERGETLRGAFEAFWRGASEEWLTAAEERAARERVYDWRSSSTRYTPRGYPPNVIAAYQKLNLQPGVDLEEVHKKRRELIKRSHPDRFVDLQQRARAEKLTAEINAAHDTIERYLLRS